MKKTLILAAAFSCAAFTANAAVFVDTWSTWTTGYQTSYGAGNGSLKSDVGSTGGTTLAISNGNTGPFPPAMLGYALYSYDKVPSFTFANTGSWTGVTQLVLRIAYGGPSQENTLASLSYNGGALVMKSASFVENDSDDEQDPAAFINTYTWDITGGVDLSAFTIQFGAVGGHTAYESFTLTAVPEPSTYALLAGAFGLAAVVVARRRRA